MQNFNDKEYTEGISTSDKRLARLDNFWYHYKWPTIAVAFFLIVGLVCGIQMCTKEANDLIVLYSGRNALLPNQSAQICAVLESVCPEDFDGDGKKSIAISTYNVLSEEQIKEMREEKDENGKPIFVDTSYYTSQYSTYCSYIMTGESSVAFLEPWLYDALVENERLQKLSDVLGYKPEGAVGEYGVRLGDTELYKSYGVMRLLPEDTVVCLLSPLWKGGKSSKEEYYAREKAMFEAIVEYTAETSGDGQ